MVGLKSIVQNKQTFKLRGKGEDLNFEVGIFDWLINEAI